MPSPRPLLLTLVWLLALLGLACHRGLGPVTPLVPPVTPGPKPPPPPLSLTASDGTGLVLASLHARAVLDDPLALTELELAFDNPHERTVEGRFEIVLPPGARITRFALQGPDGQWQEAEVVERQQARQVYEVSLYEGRDPALLERDSGNRFGARVFPIEAFARKRILVSYVEELVDPTTPWRLALRGLPALESLAAEVLVVEPSGRTRRVPFPWPVGVAPTRDLVVPRDAPHVDGVRHGEQVTARVQPLAGVELPEAEALHDLTVLVDTSASRALDFEASLATLARVLQALARDAGAARLRVLAFDQAVAPIYDGPLVGFGPDALAILRARRPLGASSLEAVLDALADGEHPRVLLMSDGLASAGEQSDAALRRKLGALASAGVERLDALVLGRVHDEDRLRRLVAGPLPRAGVLLHPELPAERIAARIRQPTLEGVRLVVPGARWWSPTRLDGLQPDDHVLVHADLSADQALRVQISGPVHHDIEVPLRATESPLHEQGWRRAQIEGLVQRLAVLQDELESTRLRRHVVELSVRYRIVNDLTALLVLEDDEEYARFGLDRRALEDVLVVGPQGPLLVQRDATDPSLAGERLPSAQDLAPDRSTDILVLQRSVGRSVRHRGERRRGHRQAPAGANASGEAQGPVLEHAPPVTVAIDTSVDGRPEPPIDAPEPEPEPEPEELDEPEALDDSGEREPITEATVSGRVVTMEEFRNVPVGNASSRDFTAVIEEPQPIKSTDSAGISLAGTTGAESVYGLPGVSISPPRTRRDAEVLERRIEVEGVTLSRRMARIMASVPTGPVESCYFYALGRDPELEGRLVVHARMHRGRPVAVGKRAQVGLHDDELMRCLEDALQRWRVLDDITAVTATLVFYSNDGPPSWFYGDPDRFFEATQEHPLAEIQRTLTEGDRARAWSLAVAWRERDPVDVLALVALGQVARLRGDLDRAMRAYGSIIDLHPSRAELLRFAAAQLEALGEPAAVDLAIDAYRKAVEQRPDHPSGHRNLALALLRRGEPQAAFEALERGLAQPYPPERFPGIQALLRDDLGIAGAAWLQRQPTLAATIHERLAAWGAVLATTPSLRIALTWESDVSDVDLGVSDASGDGTSDDTRIGSGGQLVADVTTGFGPECVVIPGEPMGYPYGVTVSNVARGPMGYGMGKVSVLHHDGAGNVHLDDRPFVGLEDGTWLSLGKVYPPPPAPSAGDPRPAAR